MARKQRGTIHKSPEELELDRRERERQSTAPPPVSPLDEPPSLPPILRALPMTTIGDFALNLLMAQHYARLAREGGLLNVDVTEEQAVLIVLRGFEMGVAPLRALGELYLAPTERGGVEFVEEAGLMREQVARSGLGVIEPLPERCSATTATVRVIRHDRFGRRQGEFTYTLEDAQADGLLLKKNWQSGANREALLTARATTKAKRAWFSDVEGARYTVEELGGGGASTPGDRPQVAAGHTIPPSPPPRAATPKTPTPAPATSPEGAGHVSDGDVAGATDAGGPTPPVASPPGAAAAPPPPSPPPPRATGGDDGPAPGATRQAKMAYYAAVSQAMNRPWTSNVGMSRDPQPVPIITHGVTTTQITQILNYTVKGRTDFARADEAFQLVVDHLGTLGIDTQLCPAPYCFFALSQAEADQILQGLAVFARSDAAGDANGADVGVTAPPPENRHDEVPDGQQHSWNQANDYLEAVLRRLVHHASKADVLGMIAQATNKEFYELAPDELYAAAADLDRLGKNPTILQQAIARMRIARNP